MKAFFITWLSHVRDSYWFVPSVMAISAMVLSFVTVSLDIHFGAGWLEEISWLYANQPEGARAVLSTVAGSMITVAGVTFSMTILSISYTTSQVGPRLLNNFMRDTGNPITLGVFISTFLYCLMVLRTVRNGEDGSALEASAAFVPHIAIIVGIAMAAMLTLRADERSITQNAVPEGAADQISDWALAGVIWSDASLTKKLATAAAEVSESPVWQQQLQAIANKSSEIVGKLESFGWKQVKRSAPLPENGRYSAALRNSRAAGADAAESIDGPSLDSGTQPLDNRDKLTARKPALDPSIKRFDVEQTGDAVLKLKADASVAINATNNSQLKAILQSTVEIPTSP